MSVVEDSRKLLQDFVAPELRAIDVRLAALEKRFEQVDARFERLENRLDSRFEKFESNMEKRFDQVTFEIRRLTDFHEMELRIARLESDVNQKTLASGKSATGAAQRPSPRARPQVIP